MNNKDIKIWKAVPEAKAGFMATPEGAALIGDEKHFVTSDMYGTTIAGPLNIMTTSENIRTGGLFVQMNDFVKMIPSTIVTPIPPNIPFPPIALFGIVALTIPLLIALKG